MNRIVTRVHAGAQRPFRLLHISDTHLTLADDRDCERKRLLAEERARFFPAAEDILAEAERYARETGAPIVHTGDLIDFVSEKNLDRAWRFAQENDLLFAAGNHEFSLYVGEAFEDEAYRNQSLAKVQAAFSNDIRFTARQENGVNLIAVDNSYYLFDHPQLDALRREIARGLPILLFMHTPLYEPALFRESMERSGFGYVVAAPEELMRDYSEYRFRQQRADEVTLETVRLIESEPLIRAIFAGHTHFSAEGRLACGIPQYVNGLEDLRLIEVD